MPFNRVNDLKALSNLILLLSASADKSSDEESLKSPKRLLVKQDQSTFWIPGLLIIPFPEAGWLLGYIDVAYWACFLYVLGSLFYVVDSFYMWGTVYPEYTDDSANPAIYWNTIAVVTFVVNALVCFLDWYLQVKQLSTMNIIAEEDITIPLQLSDIPNAITWHYFFNNLFFLGAAVVYLIQAIWMENPNSDLYNCSAGYCGSFWINFWGSALYLLSSVFAVFEFLEDRRVRRIQNLPPGKLFTLNMNEFEWFGWGDILYVVAAFSSLIQAFFMFSAAINDDDTAVYYLYTNVLFLVDSLSYFIGYIYYIFSIRRALITGQLPLNQADIISDLIYDCIEEDDENVDEEADANERISTRPTLPAARQSIFVNQAKDGMISIHDIKEKLKAAKAVRIRRTEALLSANAPFRKSQIKRKSAGAGFTTFRSTLSTSPTFTSSLFGFGNQNKSVDQRQSLMNVGMIARPTQSLAPIDENNSITINPMTEENSINSSEV